MKKHYILLFIVGTLFVLAGCGGGGGSDAPFDSTITTSKSSLTWDCVDDGSGLTSWLTDSFIVLVKDKNGIPLDDVDVSIFYPLAQPFNAAMQLYDGDPDSGGKAKDSPFSATTDENGVYTLYFKFQCGGGITYKGDFDITSGSLFKSVTFEVTASTPSTE